LLLKESLLQQRSRLRGKFQKQIARLKKKLKMLLAPEFQGRQTR
jgi:hypothetical protein